MSIQRTLFLAGVGCLLAAMPLPAHHSFAAEFDSNKPVTLQGKFTKMDWVNPHSWIKGRSWIDQSADFHSDAIHVVERITPIDSNNLAYEATIEDPKVYTQPWKIAYFFSKNLDPKYEALEFACWEGEVDLTKH